MSHYYCDIHDHEFSDYGCEDCHEEQEREEAKREHAWMKPFAEKFNAARHRGDEEDCEAIANIVGVPYQPPTPRRAAQTTETAPGKENEIVSLRIVKSTEAAKQAYLKLGLYGKSGSGKTLTALLMAEGLVGKRRILYVDTEDGTTFYRQAVTERKVHPAAFDFDLLLTKSLSEVLEAMETVSKDYSVVVIDSITHLWEAAQNAYTGKRTSTNSIPVQAWGPLKKPFKQIIAQGLNGNFHFLLCGREGVVMEEDDQGDLKVTGARMKAEGETPYEPHILGRMVPERQKDGSQVIRVFFEKDRSGVLAGRTFPWPNYSTIEPLRAYLSSGEQPKLDSTDEAAAKDAAAIEAKQEAHDTERREFFNAIRTALLTATNADALKAAWLLTHGKKTKLGDDLFEQLAALKDGRKAELLQGMA